MERSGSENWRSGSKHVGLVNKISAPVNVHGFGSEISAVDKRYMPFCVNGGVAEEVEPMNIAVVTRAQSRMNAVERTDSVNKQMVTRTDVCNDACTDELSEGDLEKNEFMRMPNECVSHKELVKLQRADVELKPLFVLWPRQTDMLEQEGVAMKLLMGVLVRRWSEKIMPQGMGLTQIVAPGQISKKFLNVAHDISASGHFGTQKTLDRLLRHFWWPGMNTSVREYCRLCDVCQR